MVVIDVGKYFFNNDQKICIFLDLLVMFYKNVCVFLDWYFVYFIGDDDWKKWFFKFVYMFILVVEKIYDILEKLFDVY